MDVTPLIRADQQVIQSYANGIFRISGTLYEHAVFITPDTALFWDINNAPHVNDLSLNHFAPMIAMASDIDVLLLGCGSEMAFLPAPLRHSLKQENLSVDIMDTGAACRTYNVLMAEGRRVACALMPY